MSVAPPEGGGTDGSAANAPPIPFGRMAVIGGLMVAIGPVSLSLYTPALPAIVEGLGTTPAAVKLTVTSYFAGFALAQLVCGPLSDAWGRRPVAILFLALYGLASLACALAPDVQTLIAARVLQGVGAAAGVAVTRAMVRDGFTGQASARLLNLIGLFLAIGPAVSPTLGAAALALVGWHSVFVVMCGYGLALLLVVILSVPETLLRRDVAALRPRRLASSFARLVCSRVFMRATTTIAMALGGLYTMAAILPFVLIDTLGLAPFAFALSMLIQTGAYVASTLVVRRLLVVVPAARITRAGTLMLLAAGALFALGLRFAAPSYGLVMVPVALWAAGVAMVMPGATTDALADFPHMAGAASSLMGFFQIGGGLAGSALATAFADPVTALATVIPAMGLIAAAAQLVPAAHPSAAPPQPRPFAPMDPGEGSP